MLVGKRDGEPVESKELGKCQDVWKLWRMASRVVSIEKLIDTGEILGLSLGLMHGGRPGELNAPAGQAHQHPLRGVSRFSDFDHGTGRHWRQSFRPHTGLLRQALYLIERTKYQLVNFVKFFVQVS